MKLLSKGFKLKLNEIDNDNNINDDDDVGENIIIMKLIL
jgi:hypothetical protein